MNTNNFATEILTEIKHSCTRWKIAFVVMTIIELLTLYFFLFGQEV